jgi:hypothetical protein
MKIISKALICAIAISTFSTTAWAGKNPKKITVAFYNIENLFDTEDDPTIDDEEFLPTGKNKWDADRYQHKLDNMAKVIDKLGDEDGPEILGVCEVENKKVMQDLIATETLKGKNYDIVHVNSPDARGIDVGFFYKKDVFTYVSHAALRVSFDDEPDFKTRDILMVKGLLKEDTVFFFVNHWPSRRGGERSIAKRKGAAQKARSIIDSVLAKNPNAKMLLMGDFNDEPADVSVSETLNASTDADNLKDKQLFNAMGELKKAGKGSHQHSKEWNMLDQIIVTQGFLKGKGKGMKIIKESASIYDAEFLKERNEKYKGAPYRTFAGAKYLGGYSDHFPVYIHLK